VLQLDVEDPKDVARIKLILRAWFTKRVLTTERRKDANRRLREFVIPGTPEGDKVGEKNNDAPV
jgi:hypothetical protein